MKRVGLLTGGGDCPGLNAVIRAVSKSLLQDHYKVIGFEDGFLGLIENRYRSLSWDAVSGILQQGGTILGSSNKANPFHHPTQKDDATIYTDCSDQTIQNASDLGLEAVVCIGGDGTMTIAKQLMEKGLSVIGVPKTIDNDLYGTDITFGYDTAVSIATEAIDRIHTTASSHHRVMLIEIMGRYAGWLTLGAGLAGGADIILIPEIEYNVDVIAERVLERSRRGRRFSIVAVSEGAKAKGDDFTVQRVVEDSPDKLRLGGISIKLCSEIEDVTGLEARATILGHLQRGGTPSAFDRILATRYGVAAAELVRQQQFGDMVALQGNSITSVAIEEIGGRTRTVDPDHQLIRAATATGVSMGI
ncbi:ATP-dependent 6-phosphofructokinase [candidate division KSB1 bacterium]|nr:ATP-dependent 6-phosphofructokinase [candidate division KSB1 bacterium]